MGEKEGKGEKKEKKEKKGDGEKKKEGGGGGGGEKKEDGPMTVVMKVDMHCEGCGQKVKRSVKGFEGVETVTVDSTSNKLTVVGKVDPWKLRERVEAKTHKKVELISPKDPPPPKKDDAAPAKKPDANGGDKAKSDDKKPKAPTPTTVALKIRLHCEGCIQRIRKTIYKIKGVDSVTIDSLKDLVTVVGTMDTKALPGILKDKLKRGVEVVPQKGDGGGDKKEKGGDGGGDKKEKGGGGDKKEKGGDGGGEKKEKGGGGGGGDVAVEANKMEYHGHYGQQPYVGPYHVEMVHAPQLFSDENPNACSVM